MIQRYPDGVAGIALVLMRLTCALIAFSTLARLWPAYVSWWPAALPSATLAIALVAGFGTRMAAALLVLAIVIDMLTARGDLVLLLLGTAGNAVALILFGPGAYSIDARRFGRRVIRLEPRSPDRGGGD